MKTYRFTPTAAKHLAANWRYSVERWGRARADRYVEAIETAVAKAAAGEKRLRPCEEYGAGLHSVRSGAHVIFLRREDSGLLVVIGVLHQMMEPSQHLGRDED